MAMNKKNKVEILAPAGNWAMLRAAVDAGADAVYFGVQGFNMRATARNFKVSELGRIVEYCHE
ncbi:MAG: U32 family peptidase, partial [Candidatus Woesearchaeota archaeon]|nr:U32 family peptidase [Candidatus Woesearchaeota archaeon]